MKICHINIKSIRNNKDTLEHYIRENNIDIVMLNETWLKPNENININGYKSHVLNRKDGYGGVGFLVKNQISARPTIHPKYKPIEIIEIEFGNTTKYNLLSMYIPPNTKHDAITNKFRNIIKDF